MSACETRIHKGWHSIKTFSCGLWEKNLAKIKCQQQSRRTYRNSWRVREIIRREFSPTICQRCLLPYQCALTFCTLNSWQWYACLLLRAVDSCVEEMRKIELHFWDSIKVKYRNFLFRMQIIFMHENSVHDFALFKYNSYTNCCSFRSRTMNTFFVLTILHYNIWSVALDYYYYYNSRNTLD